MTLNSFKVIPSSNSIVMNIYRDFGSKKLIQYLFLLFFLTTIWSCNKEISSEKSEVFTHSCRLQKSAINFYNLSGLDCLNGIPASCFHQYFYDENNFVIKRVKRSSGNIYNFDVDSIAYDEIGRVIEEYTYQRDSVGPRFLEIVRKYHFNSTSDINPISSERFWVNENGGNAKISSEEYIFKNDMICELSLYVDDQLTRIESFEYDDIGNLKEIGIDFVNNSMNTSATIFYSNYDDMINPIRKFPFRDLFGVRNSVNNFKEYNSIILTSQGNETGGGAVSIESLNYNEVGYPIFGLIEYDCD